MATKRIGPASITTRRRPVSIGPSRRSAGSSLATSQVTGLFTLTGRAATSPITGDISARIVAILRLTKEGSRGGPV